MRKVIVSKGWSFEIWTARHQRSKFTFLDMIRVDRSLNMNWGEFKIWMPSAVRKTLEEEVRMSIIEHGLRECHSDKSKLCRSTRLISCVKSCGRWLFLPETVCELLSTERKNVEYKWESNLKGYWKRTGRSVIDFPQTTLWFRLSTLTHDHPKSELGKTQRFSTSEIVTQALKMRTEHKVKPLGNDSRNRLFTKV